MDTGIQKYLAFVQTVESGSFTKAAQKLNYSQSGISRMISDLEKEWKVSLLERSKNGVSLTSDGLRLFPYAVSVCNEYHKLQMEINELNGLNSGFIRIGTLSSIAAHRLPVIIKYFQKDYPNIDYEFLLGDYTEIENWVLNGSVDCGFSHPPKTGDINFTFMERDELMVILPKNHPLAYMESFPIDKICSEPFMLLERGGKAEVSELLEKYGLSPNIRFQTWDDYAVMSMVESGLGISILPNMMRSRCPYRIVFRRLSERHFRKIGMITRANSTPSLAVRHFMRYLKPTLDDIV